MAVRYFEVAVFFFGQKKKGIGVTNETIPPGLTIVTSYQLAQGNQGEYNFSAPSDISVWDSSEPQTDQSKYFKCYFKIKEVGFILKKT